MLPQCSGNAVSKANPPLILASTSVYRRALLERLTVHFTQLAPQVIETQNAAESVEAMALRLAIEKASAVARLHPGALVIGSDQAATLDGLKAIGKPGQRQAAVEQLSQASGRTMRFYTALALIKYHDQPAEQAAGPDFQRAAVVVTEVKFRDLSPALIAGYLDREPAFDCAGSAKCEGLGIILMASIQSDDPTALIGLPLIRLTQFLSEAGYELFGVDTAADGA
ncbi:MAG: septum formation protein Maf [Betaproteobacteria bacterium]|nr:septum formation protein Maf [Betaproteobacteria bacterium]